MIGETISHYKILEKLGEGGMGVVYKAEDTKLQRTVALKFLPPELTRDSEAKERFIQEARAAATLKQHNICTIHEIDETEDGQMFICMDYYEGESLQEKIEKGPLEIEKAIDIGSQVAEGLHEAHERDIVHRDIKPANIMITTKGQVKIMDFGLAKLRGQKKFTKEGTTVGTVAYMSPEQARGNKVDHRSDIWSLGVVLYEMITGQRPFKGEYDQAVVYSILNEDPIPITGRRSGVPMELERVVNKTLVKNPDGRYQHSDEILVDLRSLISTAGESQEAKKPRKPPLKLWVTVLLAVTILIVIVTRQLIRQKGTAPQIIRTSPLTTAPGLEEDPTWSPDGTRIAYASDESGNHDIWVQQVAVGQRINLTKDHAGYDGKPAWSPDGEWIAFVSGRDGCGIFTIPALGGVPRRIVSFPFEPSSLTSPTLSWSPDGEELVYSITMGPLYIVAASGGEPTRLGPGEISSSWEPAWAADGRRIAFGRPTGMGKTVSSIQTVECDGTDLLHVTSGTSFNHNPVWSPDGKRIFFLSDRGGSPDIWWIPVDAKGNPTASAKSLTTGAGVGSIALSKNGTRLAYGKIVERSNIWSIQRKPNRTLTLEDALPLTSENHFIEHAAFSPDGEWIAFDSNRSGNMDIWLMRKDGTELRPLTKHKAHDFAPCWSPDGLWIAFYSLRNGNRDLFVTRAAGGAITPLTFHPADDRYPVWSPDGEKIAFFSSRSGNMDIWVVPSAGGKPKQLTFDNGNDSFPVWSLDGHQLAFASTRTGESEIYLVPAAGGEPTQLTRAKWFNVSPLLWSADRQEIYAWGMGGQGIEGTNLWVISTEDGSAQLLMDFRGSLRQPSYSISSDGLRFYFPVLERVGDIWTAEVSIAE